MGQKSLRADKEAREEFTEVLRCTVDDMKPDLSRQQIAGLLTVGEYDPMGVGLKLLELCVIGQRKFPPHKLPTLMNKAYQILAERDTGVSLQEHREVAYQILHWLCEQCGYIAAPIPDTISAESDIDGVNAIVNDFGKLLDERRKARSPKSPGGDHITPLEAKRIDAAGWEAIRAIYAYMKQCETEAREPRHAQGAM